MDTLEDTPSDIVEGKGVCGRFLCSRPTFLVLILVQMDNSFEVGRGRCRTYACHMVWVVVVEC